MKSIKIDYCRFDMVVIIIATILYYFLIRVYIGAVDDIMYAFLRHDGTIDWNQPIDSIAKAIQSQTEDYFTRNGRVVIHTIVQYLCGISWGREAFFILSSLFFGLLLWGIKKITVILTGKNGGYSLLSLIVLMTLMPSPGQTMIANIAFTANYLWTSCATTWVIYYFLRIKNGTKYSRNSKVFLIILFLLSGSLHEGFSIPVSGMMFIYLCLYLRKSNKILFLTTIAYWIGALPIVFAPSNFHRAAESTFLAGYGMGFFQKITFVSFGLLKEEYLIGLFLLCFIVFLMRRSKMYKTSNFLPLFLIGFIALAFDIIVAYVGCHQLTPIALVTSIIVTAYLSKIIIWGRRTFIIVNASLIVIVGIFYSKIYCVRSEMRLYWDNMHTEIYNGNYIIGDQLLNLSYSTSQSVLRFTQARDVLMHVQNKHYFEKLSSVIATGNFDKIKAVIPDSPTNILKICNKDNLMVKNLYNAGNYIICQVPQDEKDNLIVEYIYHPGLLGKIKRGLGVSLTKQNYEIASDAHVFTDSTFVYLPIYIKPTSLDYITLLKK